MAGFGGRGRSDPPTVPSYIKEGRLQLSLTLPLPPDRRLPSLKTAKTRRLPEVRTPPEVRNSPKSGPLQKTGTP